MTSALQNGAAFQSWELDASGNMGTVTSTGSPTQTRTVNDANEIETVTGGWITPSYDTAASMISGPKPGEESVRVHYKHDAWNRLAGVYEDASGDPGDVIAQFQYDGLNRRVKKTDDTGWGHHYYYNQDWQIVEDRWVDDYEAVQTIDQYLWSPGYVDTPIVCLHDGNVDGDVDDPYFGDYSSDWRRYYLTDANHNITSTIRFDDWNEITYNGVSRNVYTPYGEVIRFDENWSGTSVEDLFDGPLYAGYFFDVETNLYQVRNRYYDAGLSVWISRDPVESDSNLYRYVNNRPMNLTDPTGEIVPLIVVGVAVAWWCFTPSNSHAPSTQADMDNAAYLDRLQQIENMQATATIATAPFASLPAGAVSSAITIQGAKGAVLRFSSEVAVGALTNKLAADTVMTPFGIEHTGLQSYYTDPVDNLRDLGYYTVGWGVGAGLGRGAGAVERSLMSYFRPGLPEAPLGRSAQLRAKYSGMYDEYLHFRSQGFTPAQSKYLTKPYVGQGHHFPIRQATADDLNLALTLRDGPFNVLRPKGISQGRFYELHYQVDPTFFAANCPSRIGGTWIGANIGLQKFGPWARMWYATPAALKATGATGILGGTAAGIYWLINFREKD